MLFILLGTRTAITLGRGGKVTDIISSRTPNKYSDKSRVVVTSVDKLIINPKRNFLEEDPETSWITNRQRNTGALAPLTRRQSRTTREREENVFIKGVFLYQKPLNKRND